MEQLPPQAQSLSLRVSDSSCVSCRSSIVKEEEEVEEEEEEEQEEEEQGGGAGGSSDERVAIRDDATASRAPGHTLKRFQGVTRKLFQNPFGL